MTQDNDLCCTIPKFYFSSSVDGCSAIDAKLHLEYNGCAGRKLRWIGMDLSFFIISQVVNHYYYIQIR
jgi:hypothetical protein